MLWTGLAIDSPLASARSVEQGLTLPVVGAIVVDQTLPAGAADRSARARWKWPCLAGGLAILAAYLVFLLQPSFGG
jgi:hypothetical protein